MLKLSDLKNLRTNEKVTIAIASAALVVSALAVRYTASQAYWAKRAVEVADQARKDANTAIQEERRPWLFVEKTEHDPNSGMIVNVTLINRGKTPAYGTKCELFHEYGTERYESNNHGLIFTPLKSEAVVTTEDPQPLITGDTTSCSLQMSGQFLRFHPTYSVRVTAIVSYLDGYSKEYRVNICYQVEGISKTFLTPCVEHDTNTSK
jgi:hypothetical protein